MDWSILFVEHNSNHSEPFYIDLKCIKCFNVNIISFVPIVAQWGSRAVIVHHFSGTPHGLLLYKPVSRDELRKAGEEDLDLDKGKLFYFVYIF